MSDLLSIGASGVRANQAGLAAVSENIANAGVSGYSRRTIETSEVVSISARTGLTTGHGVFVTGVTRAADQFKAAAVRSAGADLARTEAGGVWLDRIQSSLTGSALDTRLTAFFNAAKGVAADPTATAPRAVMLEQAQALAAAFTSTGAALATATSELDATADQAVADLNGLSAALAKVNDGLGRAPPNSTGAANLADQRDEILERMSALVDVSASFDAAGRATVRAGIGTGAVLVSGTQASTVSYARNAEGAVSIAVQSGADVAILAPGGGAIGGIVDGAQRIAAARTELAEMATAFVAGVNGVQAGGQTLDGAAGQPLFAVGASPTDISVAMTDPRGIAAAAPGEGNRGNGNMAALESLRSSAGFESGLSNMVSSNAAAIQARGVVADAQSAIHDSAITARDAISGVDLDREAVDLLRFQQAYQASSRVISIARDTFQTLLDIG
ncbi:flagellar hook-associated protein 1 FlgK [Sphingomonas sp. OV641]|uniref:flagellar hook-associated protein FlgK n=1 Tax=unclassified Sphingomonas TaxID=196159 RepID=UPI0008369B31|nr:MULTISPECIES: flagellar hook-associated protein FlgK [unclassified Sphingomonas]SEJ37139.1 flagellar hook-associated protein 1 FlgK [Sphingomonas sp. OV641]